MIIRRVDKIRPSEITPKSVYLNRRSFLQGSLAAGGAILAGPAAAADLPSGTTQILSGVEPSIYSTDEKPNSFADITTYNNFWEFGTGKEDPYRNAQDFQPRPWSIEVSGEAEKTGVFDLDEFINPYTLEERIYRLRCVEAWSMVIPWVGIPLAAVLKQFKPLSSARYVKFTTLKDRQQMPGQGTRALNWPYVEGLTIEEAANPLAILAVGLYGELLPNQNGAPIRLVVPWKYGFKSIKSIVKIEFTRRQPVGSWERVQPREYGFYSNVNPNVSHPRWSQARERRIGSGSGFSSVFSATKQETLMFNGYGDEVAHLYDGMDLRKNY